MPRLLDLFCGAGGAAMGYHRAGFEVVGVDIEPQPHYPFEFVQIDALDVLRYLIGDWHRPAISGWLRFADLDAIHASPPCQAYANLTKQAGNPDGHPRLIEPLRPLLIETGLPYVIENVPGAPLLNPVQLCGSGFGLRVRRHRLFECSFDVLARPCAHGWQQSNTNRLRAPYEPKPNAVVPVYGGGQVGFPVAVCREAMEIPWMTQDELKEAIPPAYTEHIGGYLMTEIEARAATPSGKD